MAIKTMRGWSRRLLLPFSLAVLCVSAQAQTNGTGEVSSLLQARQYEAALAKAGEQLKKNPNDPQLRFLQGLALTNLGRKNEAATVFSALTRDYPRLAEPYNNLAVIHASNGRYDEAREALGKAIQIDPNYVTAYENLADLHLQLAQQALGKVIQLNPGNDVIRQRQAQLRKLVDASALATPAAAPAASASATVSGASDKPGAAQPASENDDVLAAVRAWAGAWSARDVKAYLDFYAPDFRPPKQEARPAWEAKRRSLIESKSKIAVEVEAPQVSIANGNATVRFRQNYTSDNFTSKERKTLVLRKYEDAWKIVEERSGG